MRYMCGQWYALPVSGLQESDEGLELLLNNLLGLVRLTLSEGLANTEDNRETVVDSNARLLGDEFGRLVEDRAALRVTEDDIGDLRVRELSRAIDTNGQTHTHVAITVVRT